jgi:hypothetical protein
MAAKREIDLEVFMNLRSIRSGLAGVDWTVHSGVTTVRFPDRWCHMQPWFLAALAAWGGAQLAVGGSVSVVNPETAGYAWRFGLAGFLGVKVAKPVAHEAAGRFIALRTIRTSDDLAGLLADVAPILHGEAEQTQAVQYALSEMVRNTLEHARSDGAVVCAQLYPGNGSTGRRYFSLGVADSGQGVWGSLSTNYPSLRGHDEAVLLAIEPGITGAVKGMYGAPDNAGAGLFITRRLARASRGYFGVYSGDAFFRSSIARRPPSDKSLVFGVANYPGTVVAVELDLDQDADFAAMLRSAREAFTGFAVETHERVVAGVQFL